MVSKVVVVGGGVIGSAVVYFLRSTDASVEVTVIERDPTYARASSALSAASIRQQFSTPLSVQMSLYGIEFLRSIGERLAVAGESPSIDLHEGGYLFLATPAGESILRDNHALQTSLGAQIRYLPKRELQTTFAWLNTDDLAAGTFGGAMTFQPMLESELMNSRIRRPSSLVASSLASGSCWSSACLLSPV